MSQQPLHDRLDDASPRERVRAHFPAHQGRLTRIAGLSHEQLLRDVPYLRRSAVHEAEASIAAKLGVAASVLLTNGASQGLLVACLVLGRRTRRVAIAADCHVAVTRGLILADLMPVLVPSRGPSPTTEEVLTFLAAEPPAAMILPSPTYRGERVDLERIAARCVEANVDLIVDEVHGTQLRGLPGAPPSALDLPCELVVHSVHKYAGALVQGAVLHVPRDSRWRIDEVRAAQDLVDTTSRSNLIQASVEAALHASVPGGDVHARTTAMIQLVTILAAEIDGWGDPILRRERACVDPRKLVLRSDRASGFELARQLLTEGVDHEYANVDEVLLVFSPAHEAGDFARVASALEAVRNTLRRRETHRFPGQLMMPVRRFACRPRAAWLASSVSMQADETLGRIAREAVTCETPELTPEAADGTRAADPRLPPGTVALMPGERITEWHLAAAGPRRLVSVVDDAGEAALSL